MLQQKIDHISSVIEELQDIKITEKIKGTTKIYGQGIYISLTSDLSEAIANHRVKFGGKFFSETTVDELICILEADIVEKKLALEEQCKK